MYGAGGLKSDYAGHDKHFHGNLNIGANSLCGQYCWYSDGHEDRCFNNTAILGGPRVNGGVQTNNLSSYAWVTVRACDLKQKGCAQQPNGFEPFTAGKQAIVQVFDNRVFNHNSSAADVVGCGDGVTVKQMHDTCNPAMNSTVTSTLPSDEQIVAWAKQQLGMS
jgi:hypothetical protein